MAEVDAQRSGIRQLRRGPGRPPLRRPRPRLQDAPGARPVDTDRRLVVLRRRRQGRALLRLSRLNTGLHGHRYAVDAVVTDLALRQQRPVVMLTSDLDDMAKLCGDRVRLVAV